MNSQLYLAVLTLLISLTSCDPPDAAQAARKDRVERCVRLCGPKFMISETTNVNGLTYSCTCTETRTVHDLGR